MLCLVCETRTRTLLMGDNGISSDIWSSLLLFHCKVWLLLLTISNFVYFSFLPVKQREFPGNVRSGGRDSLPLVVAFTSKQRDSPLSYALHFLCIISHQMCCAGERAEARSTSLMEMQERRELSQGCQGQPVLCFNPNLEEKRRQKRK